MQSRKEREEGGEGRRGGGRKGKERRRKEGEMIEGEEELYKPHELLIEMDL